MKPVQLAREHSTRLVGLFKQAERSARQSPDDLLPIACQLLHRATNGLVVSRGCSKHKNLLPKSKPNILLFLFHTEQAVATFLAFGISTQSAT